MHLVTPRLTLRPLEREDAPALRGIVTQAAVGRMLFLFPADMTDSQAGAFIEDWAWTGGTRMRLGLFDDGRMVGSIGATGDAEPAVFYFLDPSVAGRGLAREALGGFRDLLFERFGVPAIHADVFTDNPASARVLEACGLVRIGEGMGSSAQRVAPAPVWLYRMTRAEWEDRR